MIWIVLTGSECDNFNIMMKVLIDEYDHIIDTDKLEEYLRFIE